MVDPSDSATPKRTTNADEGFIGRARRACLWLRRKFVEWKAGTRGRLETRLMRPQKTTADIVREVLEASPLSPADALPSKSHTAVISPAAADTFLKQMEEQTGRRDKDLDEEGRDLRQVERKVFKWQVILGTLTFAIALAGAFLVLRSQLALSAASGACGILTGGGTIILTRVLKATQERLVSNRVIREDNIRVLQAIQGALLVPDPSLRDSEVAKLAAWLRERAVRSA